MAVDRVSGAPAHPIVVRPSPAGPDMATLLAVAWLAGHRGRTREAYTSDLQQWGGWLAGLQVQVLAAGRAHVQFYVAHLEEQGRAPSTIGRKLSALAGYYAYAVAEGVIVKSPVVHVRRPKVDSESTRQGLTRVELAQLLAIAVARGPVAHALVCLLGLNGLRVSEACGAQVADLGVAGEHRTITVLRKGGKRAAVPLSARTAAAVDDLLEHRGDGGPLIGLDRYGACRLIRSLVADTPITKTITPHSLRHTAVTLMLEAGVPLHRVQDAAGHSDPRTTRRYDRARNAFTGHGTYTLDAFMAATDTNP